MPVNPPTPDRQPAVIERFSDELQLEWRLANTLEAGDAVLVGGADPVSRFIQIGTRSKFSHMAVATGPDMLIEAYDYALTPNESDEGIFRLPLGDLIGRSPRLNRILILRPSGIDRSRFLAATDHLLAHSPSFPTFAAFCIAFCGLSVPFLRAMPARARNRVAAWQVRLAADGISRMHCAETVTRLYAYAGLQIRFNGPRLQYHIDHLRRITTGDQLLPLPTEPRQAVKGRWLTNRGPMGVVDAARTGFSDAMRVAGQRARSTEPIDRADLAMPGDFARAEPFTVVGEFAKRSGRWALVA
jgi:hypothetical protein